MLAEEGRKLAADLGAARTFVELDVTKDDAWKTAVAATVGARTTACLMCT